MQWDLESTNSRFPLDARLHLHFVNQTRYFIESLVIACEKILVQMLVKELERIPKIMEYFTK